MFGAKSKKKAKESVKDNAEQGIVQRVQVMYRDSYNAKTKKHETWKKCYEAYTGELFKNSNDRVSAVINHIFATVETIKPIMLSEQPKNIVIPRRDDCFEKAIKVQRALEHEWRRTRLNQKITDSLANGLVYGTSIIGLFWNQEASKGIGEVEPVIISPFNFFIDPMATSIDNAEYVMYATYKSLGELTKAYPEKAEEIKSQVTGELDENLTFGKETNNTKNQVLYIECYMRDYAVETYVEEEEETGNKYKVTKQKFPNGRRVIIANDVLLSDGENPYEDGRFPFREWKCYSVPNQFWALGEVEVLLSAQQEMLNLYNDVIENAHLGGNPIWILDKNCGVEKNSLSNRKGLVVRKNPGTEVRREAPPPLPAYIQTMISDLKYDIQVISGIFDATRGERPTSITAGTAIQALQESSQGRIKLKTQNLEYTLADIGSMWLSRIQQFWVVPRTIRVFGGEYEANAPIKIGGKPVRLETIKKDDVDGDYDVEILAGSTMPTNRSSRLQQIISLAQTPAEDGKPVIDRRTILEYAEIDNIDDILERFEVSKQNDEMLQAQQQEMLNQQQQQQQLMNHDMELQKMEVNNQAQQQAAMQNAQLQAQASQQDHKQGQEANVQQALLNALQDTGSDVKSKAEGQANGKEGSSLQELLQLVSQLDESQLVKLMEQYPQLAQILQYINEQSAS